MCLRVQPDLIEMFMYFFSSNRKCPLQNCEARKSHQYTNWTREIRNKDGRHPLSLARKTICPWQCQVSFNTCVCMNVLDGRPRFGLAIVLCSKRLSIAPISLCIYSSQPTGTILWLTVFCNRYEQQHRTRAVQTVQQNCVAVIVLAGIFFCGGDLCRRDKNSYFQHELK